MTHKRNESTGLGVENPGKAKTPPGEWRGVGEGVSMIRSSVTLVERFVRGSE
jgi:hypothetical protein